MKIMIVDDSAFMRNMIKNILMDEHDLIEASTADEAVKLYKDSRPNLVFMDIIMQGKSGIDALKEIRDLDQTARVVMCTSVGGQQNIIDEAVNAGATDFITKPFKPEDIQKAVQSVQQ